MGSRPSGSRVRALCALAAPAIVMTLAAAPPASAASVSVFVPYCAPEQGKYGQCNPDEARFVADPGEANRVTISRSVDPPGYRPEVTYRDEGAPLRAGIGCTQLDEHGASCTGYQLAPVVATGDGDDTIEGSGSIDAGPGDDSVIGDGVLNGGPGNDLLQGGDQNDTLLGGPGSDSLAGGAGNDTLQPDDGEAGDPDVVDGGEGVDLVSYERRKNGVTVSLQQPLAGEDRLSAVEGIRGGHGDDRLTGDAGPNALEGGEGNDRLTGGEGADVLDGGPGADILDGGGGDDKLYAGDDKSAHNLLACGGGADEADELGVNALVTPTCERVRQSDLELMLKAITLHLLQRSAGRPLLVLNGLACVERPCRASVRATAATGPSGGLLLAQRRFSLARGARPPRHLAVVLTARGARALRRAAVPTARVAVAAQDGGDRARSSFLIALGHTALGVPADGG